MQNNKYKLVFSDKVHNVNVCIAAASQFAVHEQWSQAGVRHWVAPSITTEYGNVTSYHPRRNNVNGLSVQTWYDRLFIRMLFVFPITTAWESTCSELLVFFFNISFQLVESVSDRFSIWVHKKPSNRLNVLEFHLMFLNVLKTYFHLFKLQFFPCSK